MYPMTFTVSHLAEKRDRVAKSYPHVPLAKAADMGILETSRTCSWCPCEVKLVRSQEALFGGLLLLHL